jgi:hypothetical protein
MDKSFRIRIFGKSGCDKCEVLKDRLDKLLDKDEWQAFETEYCDVETEDGIVSFCESECVNPQRIPAMLVLKHNAESDEYEPIVSKTPGKRDDVCKNSRLYQYLGLQTDYTDMGKGVLSPRMITTVLSEALA